MLTLKSLLISLQILVTLMVPACCLLTWFTYPSCFPLSSWLLVQGVSSLIFLFLMLLILFSTNPHMLKHGSLDTIMLTNLITAFIVLMIIIGFTVGWTIFGSFLFISAWSGNIQFCNVVKEEQLVITLVSLFKKKSLYSRSFRLVAAVLWFLVSSS